MSKYAAMLRGIGPENPNMKGEKLRWAFTEMGFSDVTTFLTSGNVLLASNETDTSKLEKQIEAALPELLDFSRNAFVRSYEHLQRIVDAKPFGDLQHQNAGKNYLTVTFFKQLPVFDFDFPYQPEGKAFELIGIHGDALCTVVDTTKGKTPDLMQWLERNYGKSITTRTFNTVTRLVDKLEKMEPK
jgi:uncharacterized protein (DUF1697 family)